MSQSISRYVVPNDGSQVDPSTVALRLCETVLNEKEDRRKAILIVPTKRQLERTVVETVLGASAAKALIQGKQVSIQNAGMLELKTERTPLRRSVFCFFCFFTLRRRVASSLRRFLLVLRLLFLWFLHPSSLRRSVARHAARW